MANIMMLNRDMSPVHQAARLPNLLDQVKRVEKRIFPRDEALDFDYELKKRNTEMIIVLEETVNNHECGLAAYLVYARLHGVVLVHKVCVLDRYQRQGVATAMLSWLKGKLQGQGCQKLQLWVDEARIPARSLYESLGFRIADRAKDYYVPGRTGIKMVLSLNLV